MKQRPFRNLACYQLKLLIRKGGAKAREARKEWRKRWGMDFPYYKSASGIKKED